MKTWIRLLFTSILATTVCRGEDPTPMTEEIPENTVTLIACAPIRSAGSRRSNSSSDATLFHYNVWLPEGYAEDASKKYPCIFIASPSGNAGMGGMYDWIRKNGYIAIMLVESRNGPESDSNGNFLAAHDDAVQRFRLADNEKLATGFSGGARCSADFVQLRPGFRGVILQGAGDDYGRPLNPDAVARVQKFRVAMTMGKTDKNFFEAQQFKDRFGNPDLFQAFIFEGGHAWAPQETFNEAATWVLDRKPSKTPPTRSRRSQR